MLAAKWPETPLRADRLAFKKDLFQVAPQKELDWSETEEKSRCLGLTSIRRVRRTAL